MMKPGSVIVDLAAERGGNCDLTVPDQKIVTDNGVTIVGYTDFPSRMAAQASTLYSTNIRHMLTDLTPKKDGVILHNMEDDVIRGATVAHVGAVTYPPPPPKIAAIAAAKPKEKVKELTPEERRRRKSRPSRPRRAIRSACWSVGGGLMLLAGLYTPGQLHVALHRLRAVRLRRLPGDLECLALACTRR
jgi:H+-translocating NAD(P) transhydrogenase subunit alpha